MRKKNQNLKCDKTQIVSKLENSHYDNSKNQIVTKPKKLKLDKT